ncbi:hypothetical protein GCM10020255_050000 [Rhodococcus baikonurensis]
MCPALDYAATAHDEYPIGADCLAQAVRYHHGSPAADRKLGCLIEKTCCRGSGFGGRLVEDHDWRIEQSQSDEGYVLCLRRRQLVPAAPTLVSSPSGSS